jgi:antitoxin (DNA-binding transcriptional repressor) of toxin-antitoxin stability system
VKQRSAPGYLDIKFCSKDEILRYEMSDWLAGESIALLSYGRPSARIIPSILFVEIQSEMIAKDLVRNLVPAPLRITAASARGQWRKSRADAFVAAQQRQKEDCPVTHA